MNEENTEADNYRSFLLPTMTPVNGVALNTIHNLGGYSFYIVTLNGNNSKI